MKQSLVLFAVVTLLLFGCKSKKEVVVDAQKEEVVKVEEENEYAEYAGSYQIISLANIPEFNGVSPTIIIKDDGKVGGNNGCNSYFGKLNLDGGPVFSNVGSTRMACQGIAGDVEREINNAFSEGTSIEIDLKNLSLLSGETVLIKARRLSLGIGEWKLIALEGKIIPEPIVFFSVDNGNVQGTTGCNTFSGTLIEEGFKIKINDVSATEMDCEEFDTVSEVVFLRALVKVTSYKLEGSIATFYFGNKELFVLENVGEF